MLKRWKDRDMQVRVLDVYIGQKVSWMEGSNDWPGRFHADFCVFE